MIKETISELYEYVEDDKDRQNICFNIVDVVLLLIYSAISFYNGVEKITSIQALIEITKTDTTQNSLLQLINIIKESGAVSLVLLNLIVLMRNHISLYKKIKSRKEDYMVEQQKKKRPVMAVRFPAWQACLGIIWAAYLIIGVVLLCIHITGNNMIHPIGLIALSTTVATLMLGLIADIEDLLHLQPAAFERRRDKR